MKLKIAASLQALLLLAATSAAAGRPHEYGARSTLDNDGIANKLEARIWPWDASFLKGKYNLTVPNGSILAARSISPLLLPYGIILSGAYQIMYKSWDPIRNVPFATPATIFIPASNTAAAWNNTKVRNKILIRAVSYDSGTADCGPSYATLDYPTKGPDSAGIQWIRQALGASATVVFPDWEGPNSDLGIGPINGNAILDAVRAVMNYKTAVPSKKNVSIVMEGYSGGAAAIGWALQQQPDYAPELYPGVLKAATLGGLPANGTADFLKIDGGKYSGIVITQISAMSKAFPTLKAWLEPRLTAKGKEAFSWVRSHCLCQNVLQYPNFKFFEHGTNMTREYAYKQPELSQPARLLDLQAPGSPTPKIPIFLHSAVNDDAVDFQDSIYFYQTACSKGANIKFLKVYGNVTHLDVASGESAQRARVWIEKMNTGGTADPGCSIEQITLPLKKRDVHAEPTTADVVREAKRKQEEEEGKGLFDLPPWDAANSTTPRSFEGILRPKRRDLIQDTACFLFL